MTEPTRIRLEPDDYFRGLGPLVLGGVLLFIVSPLALLGWVGVIEMSRGLSGLLGTSAAVVLGAVSLVFGARQRWGWAELELGGEAITVTQGVSRSVKRTDRVERPPAGVPMSAIVREVHAARTATVYYLEVDDGSPRGPVEIARYLGIGRARLAEVAGAIERWAHPA
jgi:hypothetical protein